MLSKVIGFLKKQNSFRYILLGFVIFILLGSGLLMMPACINQEYTKEINYGYIDAAFTSASACSTTGLLTINPGKVYTPLGQAIIAILLQVGGLGITTFGAGFIIAIRRGISLRERSIIQESFNIENGKDLFGLFKNVFKYTLVIETSGTLLSLISFARYYSFKDALWISLFHAISAFNNSGFDIFDGYPLANNPVGIEGTEAFNMQLFHGDIFLIIVTAAMAIIGGLGFLVLSDVLRSLKPKKWHHHKHRLILHSRVVLTMTFSILLIGTLLIGFTERGTPGFNWLDAFFFSAMSTTSGFSTFNLYKLTDAAKFSMIILMFIGASPGSTGGGIKTTTLFVILLGIYCMATHKKLHAFHYSINKETIYKAMIITLLSLLVVLLCAFSICAIERNKDELSFLNILFESLGAYSTAGLSSGLIQEPSLSNIAKIILMVTMLIGRVGPLTVASFWQSNNDEGFTYAEGVIPVG